MWYLRAQKKRSSHDQIGLFQGIWTFGRAFPTISCGRPPGEIIQIRKTKNDFCPLSRWFFLANIYLFTLILRAPVKCRVSNHLTLTHFSLPASLEAILTVVKCSALHTTSAYLPADITEVSMKSEYILIPFAIETMFVDAIFVSDQFSPQWTNTSNWWKIYRWIYHSKKSCQELHL